MKHRILAILFFAVVAPAIPAIAQQSQPLPPLAALLPVIATDLARLSDELAALIKSAQITEARALYWEDACRSTQECGKKLDEVSEKGVR